MSRTLRLAHFASSDDGGAARLRPWAHEVLLPALENDDRARPGEVEIRSHAALPAREAGPGRAASAAGPAFVALRVEVHGPEGELAPDPRDLARRLPEPPEGVRLGGVVPVPDEPAQGGRRRLLVTDVDSTLVRQEVIDELAAGAGAQDEVAAVTVRAMAGELDFEESLRERVAALAGLPRTACDDVGARLVLSPGARELVDAFRARDWPVAAVSGGFVQILGPLAVDLSLDRYRANDLETAGGRLTGRVRGEVVDAAAKADSLRAWCTEFGVHPRDAVAVGDGANDLLMARSAGLGVAYCAKPALRREADARLDLPRLDAVLDLL